MRRTRSSLVVLIAMWAGSTLAHAGPPLLCHPFEIGDATSLPFVDYGADRPSGDVDEASLADDTLAILDGGAPVIVRMETIRRAVLHAKDHGGALNGLLERLRRRVDDDAGDPVALFDFGYTLETCRQASLWLKLRLALSDPDGYALVQRAIERRGGDPEMEFAAAVMASHPRRPEFEAHLRAAVEGAREGSLLGRNLVRQFGDRGGSLEELRASLAKSRGD